MIALLRRLPLRSVARHPGRVLLVVGASLLGTAMFTASLVVSDSIDASMRAAANARLGPIDEVVNTPDLASALRGYSALTDGTMPDVAHVLAMQVAQAFVGVDSGRTEPRATLIAVDPARAAPFGLRDVRLGPNEVAITSDLAHQLQVGAGAFVQLGTGARRLPLRVASVVSSHGIAGYSTELRTTARNLIVSPDTLAALDLRPTVVLAAADVKGHEVRGHEEVAAALVDTGLFVIPAKQRLIADARAESHTMRNVLLGGAVIGLALQLVLLVALFLLFADDHASDADMLRTLGLRRRTARRLFLAAVACYAIPAACAGAAAGLAVAAAVVQYMRGWFATGWSSASFILHVQLSLRPFVEGFAVALVTIVVAGIAAVGLLSARRGRSDAASRTASQLSRRSLVAARVAVAAGAVMTAAGFATNRAPLLIAGPVLVLGCLTPDVPIRRAPRVALTVMFGAAIAWSFVAVSVARARGIAMSNALLTFLGIVVVLLATVVVTAWQPELGRALAAVRRRDLAAARVAYALPSTQMARRAAVLAGVALVTFTVLFAPVGGGEGPPGTAAASRAAAGGYDVLGTGGSSVPIPFDLLRKVPSVLSLAPLATTPLRIGAVGRSDEATRALTVFDASLLNRLPPQLLDRGPFSSDAEAFQQVLDRPDLVIASSTLFASLAGRPARRVVPGDRLSIEDPVDGRRHEVTVAATTSIDFLSLGLLTSAQTAGAALGQTPPVNAFLAGAGADRAEEAARVIRGTFFTYGIDAHTIHELVGRVNHHYETYLLALHAYQATALLAALAVIVVLTLRGMRHRRRELSMFRAIGATRVDIERVVITEMIFVVAQGLVLGVAVAALTSYVGHATLRPGLPWVFPSLAVLGVVAGALVLTIATAVVVARNVAMHLAK
jgi:putative ABC transport system permease protein